MTERQALQKRRNLLLEQISQASDEITKIDNRLNNLLEGKGPGAGAA